MKKILFCLLAIACCNTGFAVQSTNHVMNEYVVNSGGNTMSTSINNNLCSVGEPAIGQVYSQNSSVQSGFFNSYFMPQPTATVTPTVTVTMTPIRTFGDELTVEKWVYAAPNPMRGHIGHLNIHLAETAEVEVKIFTPQNKFVISWHWDNMPAGKNTWDWNVANQPNGVFLMLVTAKNGSKTSRVIKKIALIK